MFLQLSVNINFLNFSCIQVFLLGSTRPELTGARLPTQGQILRHLLHFVQIVNLGLDNGVNQTIENASVFWNKVGYKIKAKTQAKADLRNLYERWKKLMRNPLDR